MVYLQYFHPVISQILKNICFIPKNYQFTIFMNHKGNYFILWNSDKSLLFLLPPKDFIIYNYYIAI